MSFPAGLAERVIPVRILDDTVTEGRETIRVDITAASGDVVVGSPSTTVVAIDANKR